MKCPKCAYLGFDTGDRCRNCGYDFSLIATEEPAAELSLRADAEDPLPAWRDTLDRGLVTSAASTAVATPPAVAPVTLAATAALDIEPTLPPPSFRGEPALPLFGTSATDDEPLIKVPSVPRAPLSVRRTPDLPRLRALSKPADRAPEPKLDFAVEQTVPPVVAPSEQRASPARPDQLETSSPMRRLVAAAIDYAILLSIDATVLYLTLRIASLTMSEWQALPLLPMATFLGLLKLSYFTAFTCVGGQTIGKMAVNIRVLSDDGRPLDVAHAVHRALAGAVSFFILGAGFFPALFGSDRRALHDRLAHTRVVMLPAA